LTLAVSYQLPTCPDEFRVIHETCLSFRKYSEPNVPHSQHPHRLSVPAQLQVDHSLVINYYSMQGEHIPLSDPFVVIDLSIDSLVDVPDGFRL
jgi:hypothetical protein